MFARTREPSRMGRRCSTTTSSQSGSRHRGQSCATQFGYGARTSWPSDGWRGVDGSIVEPLAGKQIGQRLALLKRLST